MSIIEIAEDEARKGSATIIEEIEMDIGCLATIEMNAFEFAWQEAVKKTILEGTLKVINRIKGKAECLDCGAIFAVENLYDACPSCGNHLINIVEGKELRVKSLVVS